MVVHQTHGITAAVHSDQEFRSGHEKSSVSVHHGEIQGRVEVRVFAKWKA
jgi:hypothetical protein